MPRRVSVQLLPALFDPEALAGSVAVVMDVLRATTTLAVGLANGAREVVPCESVDEALAVREQRAGDVLLGGERDCQLIPGFDLDNSPASWTPAVVSGRTIAFTTTNGTRALLRASRAERILTAAFVNRAAVLRRLRRETRPVQLVCAGTEGMVSIEDSLCAGALVAGLLSHAPESELNDAARLVRALWDVHGGSLDARVTALRSGRGGHHLRCLDLDADIVTAACLDRVDLVPEYLPQSRAIRPAGP